MKDKEHLYHFGYLIIDDIYSENEVNNLIKVIDSADKDTSSFRKTDDLFAIRTFLQTIPEASKIIWNKKITDIVHTFFGTDYFVVKSIYFDKPPQSNWFVAWHQDLTVSVDKKSEANGFSSWTVKQGQVAVQPTVDILNNIYTIRIHLDDCDETNGALKVLPQTHSNGITRPETLKDIEDKEETCNVKKGGIMIMKPLLMHSSSRSTADKQRRVIHIELSNVNLPNGLEWREKQGV